MTETNTTITGLTPNVTYTFKVQARNQIGHSIESAPFEISTLERVIILPPNAVTDLANVPSVTKAD
jgi:hypothetical protein